MLIKSSHKKCNVYGPFVKNKLKCTLPTSCISFKHKYTAPIQNSIVSVLMKGERFEINLNSKKLLTLKSVKKHVTNKQSNPFIHS
ncbi:hypothetical protein BLOT_003326 [Blomia tropicalis]|nr:hypothetical protein BLOT_003326 [Blomia tropicalis]